MTATEYVVLVDEQDRQIGLAEKLLAHEQNLLHRAFSAFVFRRTEKIELLLQQRAKTKYHCPLLWTNTCCSHPREQESVIFAGERRLKEELGLTVSLKDIGYFQYNAHFNNGLSENEIDHVLVGFIDAGAPIQRNPDEVQAVRWIDITSLEKELRDFPARFTPWLSEAFSMTKAYLDLNFK